MSSTSDRNRWTGGVIGLAVILMLAPAEAGAHGGAVPIEFWGGFTRGATQCLRRITVEARRCARHTYSLRRRCKDAEIRGSACDKVRRDFDLDAIMGKALNAVDRECTGGQLSELGLIITSLARTDARQFCLSAEEVLAQTYYPAEGLPGDATRVHCALITAELNEKLFDRTLELKAQALDRIAASFLSRTQKLKMLNRIGKRIATTRDKVVAQLQAECPDFEAIYSRSLSAYTTSVEQSANCALSFLYVQSAVVCPPAGSSP